MVGNQPKSRLLGAKDARSGNNGRSMLKCHVCRQKKVKCQPTLRDWRERKCDYCQRNGYSCGPNSRFGEVTSRGCGASQSRNLAQGIFLREKRNKIYGSTCPIQTAAALLLEAVESEERLASLGREIASKCHCSAQSQREVPHVMRESVQVSTVGAFQEIDQCFRLLGQVQMVKDTLEKSLCVFESFQKLHCWQEQVYIALNSASRIIAFKRCDIFSQILAQTSYLDDRATEGVLLRFSWLLESFLQRTAAPGRGKSTSLQQTSYEPESKFGPMICYSLYEIHIRRDDLAEADNWLRRYQSLARLLNLPTGPEINDAIANSVQAISRTIDPLIEELGLSSVSGLPLDTSKATSSTEIGIALEDLLPKTEVSPSLLHVQLYARWLHRTPLHLAAEGFQTSALSKLVCEFELEERDIFGMTPLAIACSTGNSGLTRALVQHGARVDAKIDDGRSILTLACGSGSLECSKCLLDEGASLEYAFYSAQNPLSAAAHCGSISVCQLLLERGASRYLEPVLFQLKTSSDSSVHAQKAIKTLEEVQTSLPEIAKTGGIGEMRWCRPATRQKGLNEGFSWTDYDKNEIMMSYEVISFANLALSGPDTLFSEEPGPHLICTAQGD